MKKLYFFILLLAGLLFVSANGCKEADEVVDGNGDSGGTTTEKSTFSGQVIDLITGSPLEGANIVVTGGPKELTLTTDAQGKYSGTFDISAAVNLTLLTVKSGYLTDTASVFLPKGKSVAVSLIELSKQSTNSIPSGEPKSIFLKSISSPIIGVKESGSEETAKIIFEVQDSAGVPIDLTNSVDVAFRFGSHPGGGEVLNPPVVKTNNSGLAVVNLTSGTKAGVVQITAEINYNGKIIKSLPVAISIHGGLPDSAHFSIAAALYNFPGWHTFNVRNTISAFAGDKYSNPVIPNTSVYFSSTGGIIEGSALTNAQGIGSVELISADPRPVHPVFGAGFATVTASTADENMNTLKRERIILFSGEPIIDVLPVNISIPHQGYQSFTYTVQDENGNPLSKGTNINVQIQGDNVKGQGDLAVTLPDTQSKWWTQFSFLIYDTNDTLNIAKPVSAKIVVSGPNGSSSYLITGTGN